MRLVSVLLFIAFIVAPGLSQSADPALLASGPHAEHKEKLQLFGQFIGFWSFEAIDTPTDGIRATVKGEMRFQWILQGRAVQDVWLETERQDAQPKMYGTTVRLYDAKTDTWKVVWIAPAGAVVRVMTGRPVGPEIVMEGEAADGVAMRWVFFDIKPNSFRWRGERRTGTGWRIYKQLFAQRKTQDVCQISSDRLYT